MCLDINMARKIVQDDKELMQVSQMELKKLQRQYRIMENDKNSYANEIKCYISKQRLLIFFENRCHTPAAAPSGV